MKRNMSISRLGILSALLAGSLSLNTVPANADSTGVSATEIKLGMPSPISGSAGRVYGKLPGAMKAYFEYINSNGGVYGRKIKLVHRDDAYNQQKAATQTTKLAIEDNVFAIVGALGTATHEKAYVAAGLGKRNIPDLFVNTGASQFANKSDFPTTFMILPTYAMEAKVMAKVIKDNFTGQASFLFAQDDEFGDDAKLGFANAQHKFSSQFIYPQGTLTPARATAILQGIKDTPGKPVLVLFGTTDVTATILKAAQDLSLEKKFTWLAGSVGADATTLVALGVKPATIDGILSASFMPDATNSSDPYVKQFIAINKKYNKGVVFDNYVLAAMNTAMLTVQALRAAGKNLTRAGLMSAIEAKGSKFASAGLVPLGYSATSRIGYNGYWVSQLNAKGEGKPYGGKLVIYTTDSGAGAVEISNFTRPTMPRNGIPTNS